MELAIRGHSENSISLEQDLFSEDVLGIQQGSLYNKLHLWAVMSKQTAWSACLETSGDHSWLRFKTFGWTVFKAEISTHAWIYIPRVISDFKTLAKKS